MESSNSRRSLSLLTMLLLVAICCLSISHFNTSRQLAESQRELRRIRDEVGYLTVEDETKVNIVALQTGDPNTWQWRLYIPKGARYKWNVACEDIVLDSPTQKPNQGVSNEPYWESSNRVLVTARLIRNQGSDKCTLSVTSKIGNSTHQMGGTSLRFSQDKLPSSSIQRSIRGTNGTETVDPAGPIFLIQQRDVPEQDAITGQFINSQPTPGFMIWLSKW